MTLALHVTSPPILKVQRSNGGEDIMYSIGEYARIAQVSKRLLRYYDEIGVGSKDLDDIFFATIEVIALSAIIWLAVKWREPKI